jgi:ATP/maltotriose-dependent transcriptional regulator MalT
MVVFDNYQEVPERAPFHEIILDGLSRLPEGLSVILLSRKGPPPILIRMRANELVEVLAWDELRLTLEESAGIIRLRTKPRQSKDSILRLHNTTDGWVAGLILMLESAKEKGIDPKELEKLSREEIFEYFASEIFNKSDKDIQDFLLKTALLPKMTAKMAEELTGLPYAGRILSGLRRTHYFTEKRFLMESMYQYHPLFREFLLSRGKDTFSAEDRGILGNRAAMLLEEASQTEAAIALLGDMGNWDELNERTSKKHIFEEC